jgi:hypothetical protein
VERTAECRAGRVQWKRECKQCHSWEKESKKNDRISCESIPIICDFSLKLKACKPVITCSSNSNL